MADFGPAFQFLLPHEGGYVNDPEDLGGETKYGISKRAYPNLDIRSLTEEDAAQIYHRDYWQPQPFGLIISQRIANKVFDMAVNMGLHEATVLTQRACNENGQVINVDGKIGPLTIQAINACNPDFLIDSLRYQCRTLYMTLAAKKPHLQKFLNGWIKRANS